MSRWERMIEEQRVRERVEATPRDPRTIHIRWVLDGKEMVVQTEIR